MEGNTGPSTSGNLTGFLPSLFDDNAIVHKTQRRKTHPDQFRVCIVRKLDGQQCTSPTKPGVSTCGRQEHRRQVRERGAHPQLNPIELDDTGYVFLPDYYNPTALLLGISHRFFTFGLEANENIRRIAYPLPVTGEGVPCPIQVHALTRWNLWAHQKLNLTKKLHTFGNSGLQFFFNIFDDYFFRGTLRPRTRLQWHEDKDGSWGNNGLSSYETDPKRPDCVTIEIRQPRRHDDYDGLVYQNFLATLLHEMAHAIFQLFECTCSQCNSLENTIHSVGCSGHGPDWRGLVVTMENEANRSFRGLGVPWRIMGWQRGDPSYIEEEEEIARSRREEARRTKEEALCLSPAMQMGLLKRIQSLVVDRDYSCAVVVRVPACQGIQEWWCPKS